MTPSELGGDPTAQWERWIQEQDRDPVARTLSILPPRRLGSAWPLPALETPWAVRAAANTAAAARLAPRLRSLYERGATSFARGQLIVWDGSPFARMTWAEDCELLERLVAARALIVDGPLYRPTPYTRVFLGCCEERIATTAAEQRSAGA